MCFFFGEQFDLMTMHLFSFLLLFDNDGCKERGEEGEGSYCSRSW